MKKRLMTLFLIVLTIASAINLAARFIAPPPPTLPGPAITRAEAHAAIDHAFDLIEASANRIAFESSEALRSDLSASRPSAATNPPNPVL